MPTVTNDTFSKFPKGVFIGENELNIPDGIDFVFAPAADGIKGTSLQRPGDYVFPNFSKQVDNAYKKGVLIGGLFTLRINGNDYPMDFPDPDKDRQLNGFMYALKSKIYAMWALTFVTEDSPEATINAITNFGNNLRERTGKRGFLVVSQAMWEGKRWNSKWSDEQHMDFAVKLQNEIGNANYSKWSLLIIGQYNVPIDKKVYTPGNFSINYDRNIVWENKPREYILWMEFPFNAKFLGVTWPLPQVEEPPVEDPESGDDGDDESSDEDGDAIINIDMSEIGLKIDRTNELLERLIEIQEDVYRV